MSPFELFFQLPLFEGLDESDLFSLIPKISLDFENYRPREVVLGRYTEPNGLVYLLKGTVNIEAEGGSQVIHSPVLLSYCGLFGTNRQYFMDVTAKDTCSVLTIETKSLVFLLRNSPVFLSNYLGLLSDTIDTLYFKKNGPLCGIV